MLPFIRLCSVRTRTCQRERKEGLTAINHTRHAPRDPDLRNSSTANIPFARKAHLLFEVEQRRYQHLNHRPLPFSLYSITLSTFPTAPPPLDADRKK